MEINCSVYAQCSVDISQRNACFFFLLLLWESFEKEREFLNWYENTIISKSIFMLPSILFYVLLDLRRKMKSSTGKESCQFSWFNAILQIFFFFRSTQLTLFYPLVKRLRFRLNIIFTVFLFFFLLEGSSLLRTVGCQLSFLLL